MSRLTTFPTDLAKLLRAVDRTDRAELVRCALSLEQRLGDDALVVAIREALARQWKTVFAEPFPTPAVAAEFQPPLPLAILSQLSLLNTENHDEASLATVVVALFLQLHRKLVAATPQPTLFPVDGPKSCPAGDDEQHVHHCPPRVVSELGPLIAEGFRFGAIYVDPPWEYENTGSNGAAANHYPTMTLDQIRRELVADVAADDAHLHLWTTNAFLPDAIELLSGWGFHYKSLFVWVKPELGMGNYWRVSHELLLLGVRGRLPFRDRSIRSWLEAHRTAHSRKPGIVRELIERVSPGPYLEMYGREEIPHSHWTVYGNQVDRRLF